MALPNVKLIQNKSRTEDNATGITSRASTFLDSYIYMKNSRYNAMYEKNKQILNIENEAIKNKSADYLYIALTEQYRILESIVTRMRNFAFKIKEDVVTNIRYIIPDGNKISKFESILDATTDMPKFKYLKYDIKSIEYPSMNTFYSMAEQELRELISHSASTSSVSNIINNGHATKYIIDITKDYKSVNDGLLSMEEMKIMTAAGKNMILHFYKNKGQIITIINKDFRTYQFFLREFRNMYNILSKLEPKQSKHNIITVLGSDITFTDYVVVYKHFSSIFKQLLDVVSYYDNLFYTKLYALQSNIEMYNSIIDDMVDYYNTKKSKSLTEAYDDGYMNSDTIDAHNLINGNYAAQELLWDDTSDDAEEITLEPDKIKDMTVTDNELLNAEKECPIKEETSWTQSTGEEVGSICTARNSIVI